MNVEEFYVTLVSNSSQDVYPTNNSYHFTNILAKELHFPPNEKWRVCLSSITLANGETYIDEQDKKYMAVQETNLKRYLNKINRYRTQSEVDLESLSFSIDDANAQLLFIYESKLKRFYENNPIFIYCDQIQPILGTKKILSSFILNPYQTENGNNETIIHQPNSEEYFDLASDTIREISISLLNPEGKIVYDSVTQPTIVVLKFKRMNENYSNIYSINITNEKGTDPTDFKINFPETLVRDGTQNPWEIAVSRVSLIPLFKNFPSGEHALGLITNADADNPLTEYNWSDYFQNNRRNIFFKSFRYRNFETVETLIGNINLVFSRLCEFFELQGKVLITSKQTVKFTVTSKRKQPKRKAKKSKVKPPNSDSEEELAENSLSSLDNSLSRKKRSPDKWLYIIIPEELLYVLGLDGEGVIRKFGLAAIPTTLAKQKIIGKRPIDLHFLKPQSLLLYTNCVVPSLVGEAYGSYLTHIPIPKQTSVSSIDIPYTIYEPKNLEFHPLLSGNVNDIQIKLLKTNGEKPEFAIQNIQIFISLIFRLKPLTTSFPSKKTITKFFDPK
jgi:hypothetical protein